MIKKITTITTVILLLASCISCTPIYRTYNNTNKTVNFKNKEEAVDYFSKKYSYNREKIYFINPTETGSFMEYLVSQNTSYFYGITVNDTLKINNSSLKADNSCSGVVSGVINSKDIDYKIEPTKISTFDLKNVQNKAIDLKKGKSVIFIISTKLGKSVNKTIKKLSNQVTELKDSETDYYLICVDYYNN
ncbi:hypothetical protein ABS768_11340 [Flavobacterium sp. ST-75]|uniref:Lipoprotein n=1 Tax=Flavobacterium rhizophilum TaxID=3163296 RepID=A0ABW8YFR6_9FLAO